MSQKNNKKIVLAGGGTGGHLYPAMAVSDVFTNADYETLFFISEKDIEHKILLSNGYDKFYRQKSTPFVGKSFFEKIASLFKFFNNTLKVWRLIKRGDIVVSFGGYASIAPSTVAIIKGCDFYIHEQNSIMGRSNKIFARFAKRLFLSYEMEEPLKHKDSIVVGNIIRKQFDNINVKNELGNKIFICGGSQGSRFINNIIISSIDKLVERGYSICHQTGSALYSETVNSYGEKLEKYRDNLQVIAYVDDMKQALCDSDIVVARSGSGTVFEIMYSHRPAIYIPLKNSANNHQYHNAMFAKKKSIAEVIEEHEHSTDLLMDKIEEIYKNYEDIKSAFNEINYVDSAEQMVSHIRNG